jgi:hypothetical protein
VSVEAVASASGGEWQFYRDERGSPVVRIEILTAGQSTEERAMILSEVKDLLRSAVQGTLKPYLDIKNIHRNPLVYELRWNLGGDGIVREQLWRLYFAWHSNRGPLRLGLKFGEKPIGPSGRFAQDQHIDEAGHRYR